MNAEVNNSIVLKAAEYMAIIERREGLKIACHEEIAWYMGFIDNKQLSRLAAQHPGTEYRTHLKTIVRSDQAREIRNLYSESRPLCY